MRWLIALGLLLVVLIGSLYLLAFSTFGNTLIASIAQKKMSEALHVKATLDPFILRPGRFELSLQLDADNRIDLSGRFNLWLDDLDLVYQVRFEWLETLEPLTKIKLQGPLQLSGSAKGDPKALHVKGQSDLAKSTTRFEVRLHDFSPEHLTLSSQNLDLPALLHLLHQPHYLHQGTLQLDATIEALSSSTRQGALSATIKNGVLDGPSAAEALSLDRMEDAAFVFDAQSTLEVSHLYTRALLDSSLMRLELPKADYSIDTATLETPFVLDLHDLSKLAFVAKRPLQGALRFEGEMRHDKALYVEASSTDLGGSIALKLNGDNARVTLQGVDTLKLLHTLTYPKLFSSTLEGTLDYHLPSRAGRLEGAIKEGRMMPSVMSKLIWQTAHYDLTKERFFGTLTSDIDAHKIQSDLSLQSGTVRLSDKALIIENDSQKIHSDLHVTINSNPFTLKIRGTTQEPKISIDASEMLEKTIGNELNKLMNKLLK